MFDQLVRMHTIKLLLSEGGVQCVVRSGRCSSNLCVCTGGVDAASVWTVLCCEGRRWVPSLSLQFPYSQNQTVA